MSALSGGAVDDDNDVCSYLPADVKILGMGQSYHQQEVCYTIHRN